MVFNSIAYEYIPQIETEEFGPEIHIFTFSSVSKNPHICILYSQLGKFETLFYPIIWCSNSFGVSFLLFLEY